MSVEVHTVVMLLGGVGEGEVHTVVLLLGGLVSVEVHTVVMLLGGLVRGRSIHWYCYWEAVTREQ